MARGKQSPEQLGMFGDSAGRKTEPAGKPEKNEKKGTSDRAKPRAALRDRPARAPREPLPVLRTYKTKKGERYELRRVE